MERYKLGDIDNERFYMLPKGLFMGKYSALKLTSKVIYAFLKDKMKLSQKNGWIERNGDVYLMANQDYVADKLNLSTKTVTRGFKDLHKKDRDQFGYTNEHVQSRRDKKTE